MHTTACWPDASPAAHLLTLGSSFCFVVSVKITELILAHADLKFIPDVGLLFDIQNSSISLSFHRQILYWFLLVS